MGRFPTTVFPILLGLLVSSYLLSISWLRWGDLVVDTGHEFDVPTRLVSGKVLYRDMFYPYGPIAPYLNAALMAVFGVRVLPLVAAGLASAGLVALLIQRIARRFLDTAFSTLATLTFLAVFALGNATGYGIFSFALPYSYAVVYALLLSLAALERLFVWLEGGPRSSASVAGLFVGLTLLTRLDTGVWLLAAATFAIALVRLGRVPGRSREEAVGGAAAVLAGPVIGASFVNFAFLLACPSLERSPLSQISTLYSVSASHLTRWNLTHGQSLSGSLESQALSLLFHLLLCLGCGLLGVAIMRLQGKAPGARTVLMSGLGAAALCAATLLHLRYLDAQSQFLIAPLVCLVVVAGALVRLPRQLVAPGPQLAGILGVFSLGMLGRLFFSPRPDLYGFTLLVPGMVIYYVFFAGMIPLALPPGGARTVFRAGFAAAAVLITVAQVRSLGANYTLRTFAVASDRGTLLFRDRDRERHLAAVVTDLRDRTPSGSTVVVLPEGVMVNWLASRENPLYRSSYLPVEVSAPGAAEEIVREIREKRVDYLVLHERFTSEYGPSVVGVDYLTGVPALISGSYRRRRVYGAFPFVDDEHYGVAVYERADDLGRDAPP